MKLRRLSTSLLVAATLAGGLAACSSAEPTSPTAAVAEDGSAGIRVVSPADAQALIAAGDVVVLDVRTPAEFAEGHVEGAVLIDYQAPDFADQVAQLDPDASYVLYCRSGNRSAGARAVMQGLGFTDVADVDGGILSWQAAGLPVTTG